MKIYRTYAFETIYSYIGKNVLTTYGVQTLLWFLYGTDCIFRNSSHNVHYEDFLIIHELKIYVELRKNTFYIGFSIFSRKIQSSLFLYNRRLFLIKVISLILSSKILIS